MKCAALVVLAACGHGFFDPQVTPPPCDGNVSADAPAGPPVMYVQSNYTTSGGAAASSLTSSFPLSTAVGDTFVVLVAFQSSVGATFASLYDSSGNAYTTASGPAVSSGWEQFVFVTTESKAAVSGAESVQVALNGSAQMRLAVVAYRNAGAVDVAVINTGTPSQTVEAGLLRPTTPHDLLFAAGSSDGPLSGAFPSFSTRVLDANLIIEDKEIFSTQSVQPVASAGSNGNWVMQLVALRGL